MGFESHEAAERWAEAVEFRADQLKEERMLATYTGPERRWMQSRPHSDWTKRDEHFANQRALEYGRSADLLLSMHDRAKNRAKKDALWNGYWFVNEKLDYYLKRVAEECAPWFDGSAFR